MKAVIISAYGKADQLYLADIDVPKVAEDEVLVAVEATSINPIDWKARQGMLQPVYNWSFPVVLGWDLAGTIVQVGPAVKKFKVGDDVFARPDNYKDGKKGTYAEYAVVKEDKLALKPANLSFEEAAGIPLAGLTAYQVIKDQLKIRAGEKVLIQGGAGGVGSFAVQLAKYFGAYVATTASPQNEVFLKEIGADEVIDYHTTKITDVLHDYDAVFDTVNEIDAGISILKPNGRLVTIAGNPSEKQKSGSQSVSLWWLQPNGKQLAELGALASKKAIKVIIDSTFDLSTIGLRQAHKKSENGHSRGKIIIQVNQK